MNTPRLPSRWSLAGKSALITGAGSEHGIGFAAAQALGDLGARVACVSTTGRIEQRAGQLAEQGIDARGFVADLTDADQVRGMMDHVFDWCTTIDILVNNAGMSSQSRSGEEESGAIEDLHPQAWRAALARNLDTAFLVTRAVVGPMSRARWGRIISVASVTGPVMAMRGEVAYAAAKAGLVGMTRALAVDLAAHGITVNAVAPGWIATASQTEWERRQGDTVPMGRSGSARDVASAIAWLATPGASYVTGQCIIVDGGNGVAEERP